MQHFLTIFHLAAISNIFAQEALDGMDVTNIIIKQVCYTAVSCQLFYTEARRSGRALLQTSGSTIEMHVLIPENGNATALLELLLDPSGKCLCVSIRQVACC